MLVGCGQLKSPGSVEEDDEEEEEENPDSRGTDKLKIALIRRLSDVTW